MGKLAVRTVNLAPGLCELQDAPLLPGWDPVCRVAARRLVIERAGRTQLLAPAVHLFIRDAPQLTHPVQEEPLGDSLVDMFQHQLLHLDRGSRREQATQPQPALLRTIASSIPWALIASVCWVISERAASRVQCCSLAGRPDLAANAASAASFTVRRVPLRVDTSTVHLRAASAWVISPAVIYKKISHLASSLNTHDRTGLVRSATCRSLLLAQR